MSDKAFDIIFYTFIAFLLIIAIFITLLIIDFKNDYECSTTTDINWFREHNCEKYFK